MVKRFRKWYNNRKIGQKLILSFFCIALIPIVVISIVSYTITSQVLKTNTLNTVQLAADKIGEALDETCANVEQAIDTVVYNKEFLALAQMFDKGTAGSQDVEFFLQEHFVVNGYLNGYIAGETDAKGRRMTVEETATKWILSSDSLYASRPIVDVYSNAYLGMLVLSFDRALLFDKTLSSNVIFKEYGVLVEDSGEPIYSHWVMQSNRGKPPLPALKNISDHHLVFRTEAYMVVNAAVESAGWQVYYLVPYTLISEPLGQIISRTVALMLISIVIMAVVSVLDSLYLSRRINKIIVEMKRVASGDISTDLVSGDGDEIGMLTNGFTNMVEKINTLINDNYKAKLQMKESELKALQAQINPHFLYNCLDNINWYALINNVPDISRMVLNLSDFYRTSLNKGRTLISLKDELLNVTAYVGLQLILHDQSFSIEYDVEESVLSCAAINLTLQPLVENALEHGIDAMPDRKGKIVISVKEREEQILVSVFNTGPSIDPAVARDILTHQGKGYGLFNVHERVMLTFGREYGITIQPVSGGTLCVVTTPKLPADSAGAFLESKEIM